ncbi:polysialyltransferase family glycosyltransferase [Pseudomonas sp. C9-3]|uniref:polysialyltransferase family glycosyltransferase n=1 Tax=Pseudomonas sp. C9-3 TaxID=3078264 RepID=UPI0028E40826|nr:hypothetical protein [Pseudomonas sp. C9-3]
MIYIICTSGFHKEIAKTIKNSHTSAEILYLPKEASAIRKLSRSITTISKVIRCALTRESHAIVPHPLNLWFSLFILAARKRSFYDDGIAYYYKSKLPNTLQTKLYKSITNIRDVRIGNETNKTYPDILKNSKYENFYCLFPELIEKAKNKKRIIINENKTNKQNKTSGIIIYIDSTKETINKLDEKFILKHLEKISQSAHGDFIFFKPHPSQTSEISETLRTKSWAKEINSNLEKFIQDQNVSSIYSAYSSATITTKLTSPHTNLYCYTSLELDMHLKEIKSLFQTINVNFINTK